MPPVCTFHGVSTTKSRQYQGEYGTPGAGTETEMRARQASKHVGKEICQLLRIIERLGQVGGYDEESPVVCEVVFSELFQEYVTISNKLVGVLLRARKHGAVAFEGEMLFQGMSDGVVIRPLVSASELEDRLEYGKAEWGSSIASSVSATAGRPDPEVGPEYRASRQWD